MNLYELRQKIQERLKSTPSVFGIETLTDVEQVIFETESRLLGLEQLEEVLINGHDAPGKLNEISASIAELRLLLGEKP